MRTFMITTIICLLLMCGLFGSMNAILAYSDATGPAGSVTAFCAAVMRHNYQQAWAMLVLDEQKKISERQFAARENRLAATEGTVTMCERSQELTREIMTQRPPGVIELVYVARQRTDATYFQLQLVLEKGRWKFDSTQVLLDYLADA